jgi:hypothetical protein
VGYDGNTSTKPKGAKAANLFRHGAMAALQEEDKKKATAFRQKIEESKQRHMASISGQAGLFGKTKKWECEFDCGWKSTSFSAVSEHEDECAKNPKNVGAAAAPAATVETAPKNSEQAAAVQKAKKDRRMSEKMIMMMTEKKAKDAQAATAQHAAAQPPTTLHKQDSPSKTQKWACEFDCGFKTANYTECTEHEKSCSSRPGPADSLSALLAAKEGSTQKTPAEKGSLNTATSTVEANIAKDSATRRVTALAPIKETGEDRAHALQKVETVHKEHANPMPAVASASEPAVVGAAPVSLGVASADSALRAHTPSSADSPTTDHMLFRKGDKWLSLESDDVLRLLIAGAVVQHPERGKGVVRKVDMLDLRGKPFVIDFSGKFHRYPRSSVRKFPSLRSFAPSLRPFLPSLQ